MPEVREFQTVVSSAERAANAGDFAKAEELLRVAVALQESSVGPDHPDLAATLNNLAVACERADHPEDAERFYRRAYSVAAAALGPRHPLVVTSRDNLRDFCHARGLPLDDWALGADDASDSPAMPPGITALDSSERSLDAFGPSAAAHVAPSTPPAPVAASAPAPRQEPPRHAAAPAPVPAAPAPRASAPSRPNSNSNPGSGPSASVRSGMRPFAIALGIVAVIGTAAVARLWFNPGTAAPPVSDRATRPSDPTAPATSAPAAAPSAAPSTPAAEAPTPAAAPPNSAPAPPVAAPAAPSTATTPNPTPASAGDVRVVTATVCTSLSTAGGAWQCDAVGDASQAGRYAYYTRVAAPRALRVRHRWYQGERLRQDVTLAVAANASAGYRTFSRQTVSAGAWRVELRDDNGALLDESRFVVR